MKYFHLMNVLDSNDNASNQEFSLLLCKFLDSSNMIAQITSSQQVHYKIQTVPVVEGEMHISDKLMLKFL